MDNKNQEEQEQHTHEAPQGEYPVQVVHSHGVLTITVTLTTDIQSYIYADGTEEQVGNQRAELRITLDRDTYTDDFTGTPSNDEQVELPSAGTNGRPNGEFRSRSY
jgi:hypothetical protein